jgi:hypothetical protein
VDLQHADIECTAWQTERLAGIDLQGDRRQALQRGALLYAAGEVSEQRFGIRDNLPSVVRNPPISPSRLLRSQMPLDAGEVWGPDVVCANAGIAQNSIGVTVSIATERL